MKDRKNILETFENPYPDRDYDITHISPEFTSLCPKTGQPDFATINLLYVPNELCVELKSYKMYLQSYRTEGVYFEAVTNMILDDLVDTLDPIYLKITAEFNKRGGISSVIEVEYDSDDYGEYDELDDLDDLDEIDEEEDNERKRNKDGKYN